jgi:hypothetical protein
VVELEQAFRMGGRAADALAAIDCRTSMGDFSAAYDDLVRLEASPALTAREKAAAGAARGDLDGRTGSLQVNAPAGANVEVDGRAVGTAPLPQPLRLLAGPHAVRAIAAGFDPSLSLAQVAAGRASSVSVQLHRTPEQGHLYVSVANSVAARVLVDGHEVGASPWDGDLPVGNHTVGLQAAGFAAPEQPVEASAGLQLSLTLAARATRGHVQVRAVPVSASLELDGQRVGAGQFDGDLAAGDHLLRVSAPGYKTAEQKITVDPAAPRSATVTLEREVTPEETERARAEREAEAHHGAYAEFDLVGALGAVATHITCGELPYAAAADSCSPGAVFTGGVLVRGGYSFGLFGLEGTLVLGGTYWKDEVSYTGAIVSPDTATNAASIDHDEEYQWIKAGGLATLGPRLTTETSNVRFTMGVAGGISVEGVFLSRNVTNGLSESPPYQDFAVVAAPAISGDLGLEIGGVPGASLSFGVIAWADFPSQTILTPGGKQVTETRPNGTSFTGTVGPFTGESGAQVYVGPYLGVRFGH